MVSHRKECDRWAQSQIQILIQLFQGWISRTKTFKLTECKFPDHNNRKQRRTRPSSSVEWEGVASVWTLGIDWRTTRACSARNIWQRRRLASYALIIIIIIIIIITRKTLLCECHVSLTRVTATSLASGISIFTEALARYAAILPRKSVVKSPVCFFLFYLADPISLPSLLCFQWRLRATRPEFDSLKMQRFLLSSTVLRQTIGTIQFIHSVHGKLWRR